MQGHSWGMGTIVVDSSGVVMSLCSDTACTFSVHCPATWFSPVSCALPLHNEAKSSTGRYFPFHHFLHPSKSQKGPSLQQTLWKILAPEEFLWAPWRTTECSDTGKLKECWNAACGERFCFYRWKYLAWETFRTLYNWNVFWSHSYYFMLEFLVSSFSFSVALSLMSLNSL